MSDWGSVWRLVPCMSRGSAMPINTRAHLYRRSAEDHAAAQVTGWAKIVALSPRRVALTLRAPHLPVARAAASLASPRFLSRLASSHVPVFLRASPPGPPSNTPLVGGGPLVKGE